MDNNTREKVEKILDNVSQKQLKEMIDNAVETLVSHHLQERFANRLFADQKIDIQTFAKYQNQVKTDKQWIEFLINHGAENIGVDNIFGTSVKASVATEKPDKVEKNVGKSSSKNVEKKDKK